MTADDRLVRHPGSGGTSFILAGRRLTGDDPRRSQEARLRALTTTDASQTLYCVVSPLLGYGLREFVLNLPAGNAVLVVELDPVLAPLLRDPASEIPRSPRLGRASTEKAAAATAWRFIQRYGLRRVRVVRLSGGATLRSEQYRSLETTLEDLVRRFWLNRATELTLNHRWVINILRNSLLDAQPVRALGTRIQSRVLLVGAGPGLDNHLDWLSSIAGHPHRRRFTILAVDTVLATLAARTIRPDVVWSMDAQLVNARDFLPWRWDDLAIAADLTVASSVLRRARRENRYVFATRYADIGLFTDPELMRLTGNMDVFEPRGSVVPSAAEFILRHTAVNRVVTLGVDFWYAPPRTHARFSAIDRAFRREMTRLGRRDGFDEVERRPRVNARLDTGKTTTADGALSDHAEQFRSLLRDGNTRDIRWMKLPAPALPTGMEVVDPETAGRLLTHDAASEPAPSSEPGPSSDPIDGGGVVARRDALGALLTRLRNQEKRFDQAGSGRSSAVYWDSGLDFVLRDLPQWPLMTVRRDWFNLHRDRLLRVLRDYRRRLERIVRIL